jgi:hypothetical protein
MTDPVPRLVADPPTSNPMYPCSMMSGMEHVRGTHLGLAPPIHSPSLPHVLCCDPLSTNPWSQRKSAFDPKLLDVKVTDPLAGVSGSLQTTSWHRNGSLELDSASLTLQVPSELQTKVAGPEVAPAWKPVSHS